MALIPNSLPTLPSLSSLANKALSSLSGELSQLIGSLSLQQHARLIRLEGTPVPVLVERFQGEEGLDSLFRFEVDVISEVSGLDFADWFGKEVQLSLIDAAGQDIVRHGQIAAMADTGSDGGFSRYRLTLMPWAAWLASRQDCWVFQDKTVLEIATELLADHPQANWRHSVSQPLRRRSLCIQYQESDWAFLCRLLAEEGLSHVFEHLPGGDDGQASPASRCQLHVFDNKTCLPDAAASPIAFGRVSASLADDRLTAFHIHLSNQARSVARSSWDYQTLHAPAGTADAEHDGGAQADLEDYDGSGAYRFDDADHAERQATLRQQAHDGMAERFSAEGAVRALRPAEVFTLLDHAEYGDRRFVVRRIQHHGANNLAAQVKDLLSGSGTENGSYRTFIECQAIERPLVPQERSKPAAQLQTALVVGLPDATISSDRDHRVKLQFPWQRGASPNSSGLDHPLGDNAPANDQAFTWVRAAEWLAGPNWGSAFTPRIGDEVLVDFVESDIDRPIIVGSLYNDQAPPPFSAGHDGPANHPGHLSGYHGQGLDGSDYTRWVMDDTPGELRTQLKTSRHDTELNLGHLVAQPAFSAWRGRYRGEGVELRTDGWGSLRGEAGMLLSSHAQPQTRDTQLATPQTRQHLNAAEQLVKQLAETSQTHHALGFAGQDNIAKLHQQIDQRAGAVNGQPALKADSASRALKDPVEDFKASPIVLESPASLTASTEASSVVYAGGDLHATTSGDGQLTGQQTITVEAGNRLGLFTHHGGIKLITAESDLYVAAHTETLHLASEQALTITSTEDSIHIVAQDSVKLFGAGAEIELKGGDITFKAKGEFTVKGTADWMAAENQKGDLPKLPDTRFKKFDEQFRAVDAMSGQPISGLPYTVYLPDGSIATGITDQNGLTDRIATAEPSKLRIVWNTQDPSAGHINLDASQGC